MVCRACTKFKLAILIFIWFALVLAYIVVTVVSVNVTGGVTKHIFREVEIQVGCGAWMYQVGWGMA